VVGNLLVGDGPHHAGVVWRPIDGPHAVRVPGGQPHGETRGGG
jgi:hypothetical protein